MRRTGLLLGGALVVIATAAAATWQIVPLQVHLEMPADAYKSWFDRMIVRAGYTIRGRPPPCLVAGEGWWDGTVEDLIDHKPWEECLRFTQPQRWRGLWNRGWEWSNFCPAPAQKCPIAADQGDMWLRFAQGAYKGTDLPDGIYEVEFIGRRTAQRGGFGHLGQYDYEIIVDRMISIRKIPGEKYIER